MPKCITVSHKKVSNSFLFGKGFILVKWAKPSKLTSHYFESKFDDPMFFIYFQFYRSHAVTTLTIDKFRFHNEYDDEYEKVFVIFWTLQTNFRDSVHVEWLLGPCNKKVAAVCHK